MVHFAAQHSHRRLTYLSNYAANKDNDSPHLALTYNILNPELVLVWVIWTIEKKPDMKRLASAHDQLGVVVFVGVV